MTEDIRRFPADFAWGAATAAHQIEGALDADGRGTSIWETFAAQEGRIVDRSRPDVACDSYRRYADDAALLADANLTHYRFSISWSRILPTGEGAVNEKGLDYYARLADALQAKGVTPWATLFHWDLPQALQDKGGWTNRETAQRIADYAGVVAQRLGDRIKRFIVLNEASVHAHLGHFAGNHAPGLTSLDALGAAIHHQNLGQGLAMHALRAARGDLVVGTTMAVQPVRPQTPTPENVDAAHAFDGLWNGAFLDPVLKGNYPDSARALLGALVKDGDLAITRQKADFVGVNYYSPMYVKADARRPNGIGFSRPPQEAPRDAFGREIDPTGLTEILLRISTDYGDPLLYITENGCSDPFSDDPAVIDDDFRIDYLRAHLGAVLDAMSAGARVAGYFHWSLVDNWEWALGFTSKFGLVAMDRASGVRTPKASYRWYADLARSGELR